MTKHAVIMRTSWADSTQSLAPGESIELEAAVAHRWVEAGLAKWPPGTEPPPLDNSNHDGSGGADAAGTAGEGDPRYKATGGGWYELANGTKVHGKDELEKALAVLVAEQGGEA